jgi:tetratricopeptide (TPR) repeat protein
MIFRSGLAFVCLLCVVCGVQGTTNELAPVAQVVLSSTDTLARAGALASAKDWQGAVDLYRDVLKTSPADLKAAMGLGTSMLQLKRYKDAIDVLVPLLVQLPDDPALKNNIAWIYATCVDPAVRNPGQAVKLAQQATLALPNNPDVWNTLAEAHYAAAEYDMALRAARIALQLVQEQAPSRAAGFFETLRHCSKALEPEKAAAP